MRILIQQCENNNAWLTLCLHFLSDRENQSPDSRQSFETSAVLANANTLYVCRFTFQFRFSSSTAKRLQEFHRTKRQKIKNKLSVVIFRTELWFFLRLRFSDKKSKEKEYMSIYTHVTTFSICQ
jgi:hypothetical protein